MDGHQNPRRLLDGGAIRDPAYGLRAPAFITHYAGAYLHRVSEKKLPMLALFVLCQSVI